MTAASTTRRIVLRPVTARRAGSPEPGPRRFRLARVETEARASARPQETAAADRFAHLTQSHD